MAVLIRFEEPEAWEKHNKEVGKILKEAGLEDGSYREITNVFPPFNIIPEGLDDETITKLRELDGVIVENDD